eukprot:m.391085 g.391085  ORF g.391085 m.391085 type:complete len:440 (+) comp16758_c3_seq1:24-1343(+)
MINGSIGIQNSTGKLDLNRTSEGMPRATRARTAAARKAPASTRANATALGEIKQRLNTLQSRHAELAESKEQIEREMADVATAIEQVEAELKATVAAPISGGDDPTLWLPDELLLLILGLVAFVCDTCSCSLVCRRWWKLCQEQSVKGAWKKRWELYNDAMREPRELAINHISALCAGDKDTFYCGTIEGSICVLSGKDGSLLHTFTGHGDMISALALGLDGTVYSSSDEECTIRVWSGEAREPIRSLMGHAGGVYTLAANEVNLFSGSEDESICVWQCSTGDLVHTAPNLGDKVQSLTLDNRDQLYAGLDNGTIWVLSASDYTPLRSLEGHDRGIWALAVHKDGTLFSGSSDGEIRVWSGTDGAELQVLRGHDCTVTSLAVAPNGDLFSAGEDGRMLAWLDGGYGSLEIGGPPNSWEPRLAFTRVGRLWLVSGRISEY